MHGLVSCDRNPLKARVQVNRGSCVQALDISVRAIRDYAAVNGHLPKASTSLTNLGEFSVPAEAASIVEYGGTASMTPQSPGRTIILKCSSPVRLQDGTTGIYCGLLSGEVVILSAQAAVLGTVCTGPVQTVSPDR